MIVYCWFLLYFSMSGHVAFFVHKLVLVQLSRPLQSPVLVLGTEGLAPDLPKKLPKPLIHQSFSRCPEFLWITLLISFGNVVAGLAGQGFDTLCPAKRQIKGPM